MSESCSVQKWQYIKPNKTLKKNHQASNTAFIKD